MYQIKCKLLYRPDCEERLFLDHKVEDKSMLDAIATALALAIDGMERSGLVQPGPGQHVADIWLEVNHL